MKKTVVSIAVVIAAILMVSSPTACTSRPESITVISASSPSWLLYFANDQGYFAANGLDVSINESYSGGVAVLDALMRGEGDMAVTAEYPFVVMALRKSSISIVANINKTFTVSLVGRKDKGIETIADLGGKRIGLIRQAISEFYLGRLLDLNGLNISDVTLVNIANTDSLDALSKGEVDAVVTVEPFVTQIKQQLAGNAAVWPVHNNQPSFQVTVGGNDWISSHPETVKRFLKAMDEALGFLAGHPDDARTVFQKYAQTGDSTLAVFPENQLSLSLDLSLITAMDDEARWMIRNNITAGQAVPDFYDYIYVDGLKAVKPEAVSISR